MIKNILVLFLGVVFSLEISAQNVGVGTNNPSAKLDISASNSGILIPRVVLTATNVSAPVTSPVQSMMVYNTATSGSGSTAVTPGFYYWNATTTAWIRLLDNVASSNNIYNIDGTLTGSRTVTQGANTLTFSSTSGNLKFATSGTGSVAMGNTVSAAGTNSFTTGNFNTASGNYVAVTGQGNTATGTFSLVSGVGNVDNGTDNLIGGSVNLVLTGNGHSIAAGINDTVAASAGAVFGYKNRIAAFEAFAQGDRNTASGQSSAVFGASNFATGLNSFVTGSTNTGSGSATLVSGSGNTAAGNYTAVNGLGNTANGTYSLVSGVANIDNGSDDLIGGSTNLVLASYGHSIAAGINDTVAGSAGAVFGYKNRIAAFEAFAQGDRNTASGQASAVFGSSNYATGVNTFVTGYTNTGSGSATLVSGTGNNASGSNSSVSGQNNTVPAAASLVSGVGNTDNGVNNVIGGTNNTVTSGYGYSAAIGNGNTVSGSAGAVFGFLNTISAFEAFAQGDRNTASGQGSAVFGGNNVASGGNTVVYGLNNTAPSYAELEGGTYATTYTASSPTSISATDRLFNIGNGTNAGARADAFTILKNGNVGVGNSSPTSKLQVNGTTSTTTFQMTNGAANTYILQSDASGNGTWINPNTLAAQNIYNTNGTLTGARTVTMGGNTLNFTGGNVGIGTTSPVNLLQVEGNMHMDGNPIYFRTGPADQYDFIRWSTTGVGGASGDRLDISGYGGVNLGYSSAGAGSITNVLTVTSGTQVGIGTNAPLSKLHILHTSSAEGMTLQNTSGGGGTATNIFFATYADATVGVSHPGAKISGIDDGNYSAHIAFSTKVSGSDGNAMTERMRIQSNGFVGINTTTPGYPLDVESAAGTFGGAFTFYARGCSSNYGCASNTGASSSIYATGRVVAAEFDAFSDRRIKKDIHDQSSETMLEKADRLRVVSYQYIDQQSKGDKTKTGFIAQEVEQILPSAVNSNEGFLPSIFDIPVSARVSDTKLVLTTTKAHDLAVGDVVRIMDNTDKMKDLTVSAVNGANEFAVEGWTGGSDSIFVYGKKVSDFRNVDFDQLTAVAIGAVQELNKKVKTLEKKLNDTQVLKADASDVLQLKAEIEQLKQILNAKAQR